MSLTFRRALGLPPLSIVIINKQSVQYLHKTRVTDMTDRPVPVARRLAGLPSAVDCLIGFRGSVSIHRQTNPEGGRRMDATSHITTLFPTVSGRQPRALVPHPTLRLLGESAHSASTRPNSACRNVKHKRRCRLHLFRGPRPTPFFFSSVLTSNLTVPADSLRRKGRRRRSGPQHQARSSL